MALLGVLAWKVLRVGGEASDKSECAWARVPFNPASAHATKSLFCESCFLPTWNTEPPSTPLRLDLTNRWLYLHGDSTMRQLFGEVSRLRPDAESVSFDQARDAFRNCAHQNRTAYVPAPKDPNPCFKNERTCHQKFGSRTYLGENITITLDWKHFMYEDYDRTLLYEFEEKRSPDLFIISPGLHDCWHYPTDVAWHISQLRRLMAHIDRLPKSTTVVYVDATPFIRVDGNHDGHFECIKDLNRAAQLLAAERGMLFFSRQSWVLTANASSSPIELPLIVHQPDDIIRKLVLLLLHWLSCKTAF